MKHPAILCAVAAVVALIACGSSNNANGSFPFTGPSCSPSSALTNCFGCYEQNCNASCLNTACSDFLSCVCACNPNDVSCFQACVPKAEEQQCAQCAGSINQSSCQQACASQCNTSVSGGSGSSGGGFGSGSGVGSSSSSGSGGGQVCSTDNGACPITYCETETNGGCTSAYYEVGGTMFPCASCSDTQACLQAANDACLDGGPVADIGPGPDEGPPDTGPIPDVVVADVPVFDGVAPTCSSVKCGTMGQLLTYCEVDDGEGGACTQAWYQVGSQVFDCTSCSASGCQAAEQAASMACP